MECIWLVQAEAVDLTDRSRVASSFDEPQGTTGIGVLWKEDQPVEAEVLDLSLLQEHLRQKQIWRIAIRSEDS